MPPHVTRSELEALLAAGLPLLPDKDATVITPLLQRRVLEQLCCGPPPRVARRAGVRTYPGGIQDRVEAGNPTVTAVAS